MSEPNAAPTRAAAVDSMPGYRRRIRVEPGKGSVRAMLEDDIHCMIVTLRHDRGLVTAVEPEMVRWPWTTCPGAEAQLVATFAGQPLDEVTARREKKQNCTHLHDLAVLGATHATDCAPLVYDMLVSDPVAGERMLELRRDGAALLRWTERNGALIAPQEVAGLTLLGLRDWIASLPRAEQEPARLLQWASLVAHGRTIPIERQSAAADLPPNCYTFQPHRAAIAERIGDIVDFSDGSRVPLAGIGDR